MTTPLSVFALIVRQTADEVFESALAVARILGLPVDTWRPGDPTRTLFRAQAERIETLDAVQTELAKAAFLDTAEGPWLSLRAKDVYGVDRDEATFATPSVTLNNTAGGFFELEPGGLVLSASGSGSTYQNQTTVTIPPLTTGIVVSMIAQVGGSSGSVLVNEIDTVVSPALTGVVIASSSAALGSDEQSDPGVREECRATLGALSPAGPADAYEYVARNEDLTGIVGVTRALADGDSADGTVSVYVATTLAALDAPSIAAIQAAVDEWAQPLCTDATVIAASPQTVAVTLSGVSTEDQDLVEGTLTQFMAQVPLGGTIARDAITSAVRVALVAAGHTFGPAIGISLPASDVVLANDRFPVLGTVTLT